MVQDDRIDSNISVRLATESYNPPMEQYSNTTSLPTSRVANDLRTGELPHTLVQKFHYQKVQVGQKVHGMTGGTHLANMKKLIGRKPQESMPNYHRESRKSPNLQWVLSPRTTVIIQNQVSDLQS